ncbi:DUF5694 domain-containing protein [Flavobacterium sp. '19STA2R22 D10 B1']|uniref:DUF5694 domain-containing protein n=1 Tax=Flavobacterium aerium TaxID=3037261 RepID=UPI00278C0A8F|nr:DUF5694 domain-containing protein [Flavobacterium sp. '19STA2R22 D10 B1']
MKKIIVLLVLFCLNIAFAQTKKKQILLIGTFHFENPGLDVAKVNSFNVMTDKSQKELENMANKIKKFSPDKIFIEWNYQKQESLDKFYGKNSDSLMQKKSNEIVQLAIRSAKKLNHKKIYGIDYRETFFPYDSLKNGMKEANQLDLIKKNEDEMKVYEREQNKLREKLTLTELLLECNTEKAMNSDLGWYVGTANRAGKIDNFVGAYLVSEWYRRNLYMYSLIQKLTEEKDDKVMVLLGASHIAVIRDIIKHDPRFEIVELKDVLK